MAEISSSLLNPAYIWTAIALAALATFLWRFLGATLGSRIPPDGPLMEWVNMVAYAMAAGVMMLILTYPTGILASTTLEMRLVGLLAGLAVMVFTRRLFFALAAGLGVFAAATLLF